MAKIFDVNDWLKNHPDRNNFDLTHKVHGSYKFGVWYPFLCKPVVPTDSFKIDTAVSLRFMPMAFPTQSNMRAIFHYHYVRTKNIWKNFSNWLQGLEQHTPPYIDKPKSFYKDGSLADYLGIQTSYHFPESSDDVTGLKWRINNVTLVDYNHLIDPDSESLYLYKSPKLFPGSDNLGYFENPVPYDYTDQSSAALWQQDLFQFFDYKLPKNVYKADFGLVFNHVPQTTFKSMPVYVGFYDTNTMNIYGYSTFFPGYSSSSSIVTFPSTIVEVADYENVQKRIDEGGINLHAFILYPAFCDGRYSSFSTITTERLFICYSHAYSSEVSKLQDSLVPYYYSLYSQDSRDSVKVSALPFRAYESVMRCFYRNNQGVQPFKIGGQTVYNKWNTTTDDGADTTDYELFHRNWELDAYTSCLLSPQQDNSVYVGMTNVSALGNMRVSTPDGGEASIQLKDAGDNSIEYENLRSDDPQARRFALNVASLGFTIPQFREANALQRFLELNIRKGYRYLDFIEGHFGEPPKYSELDMPEFLGGFTQRISVNEISNTNGVDTNTLGAIAGQARAIGGSTNGITHYFDDFGFIVGVMCLVPDVAYDCLLPKHFNVKDPLDMYFPEFNNVGMMPVTHEELAPLQTRVSGHHLTDVFGYQRPNHDLVWYPDTVHGRFRDASGIGNSIVCRRFSSMPELNNSFLEIDSASSDSIFNYTLGTDDICLGEIVLKISAKRPIPRLVVPSING